MSATGPRWPSLSGLTIELMRRTSPPAISSTRTLNTLPSGSRKIAPGAPLTRVRRGVKPPKRAPARAHAASVLATRCATLEWAGERRNLAAAVAMQLDVRPEQRLEGAEVALLGGGEEARREPLLLLGLGLETWPAALDLAARADRQLARCVLAAIDDLGDPVVRIVEHVAQQEHRPLLGGEALEQNQEGERERVRELGPDRWIVALGGDQRLGQPLADVRLAPRRGPSAARRSTAG